MESSVVEEQVVLKEVSKDQKEFENDIDDIDLLNKTVFQLKHAINVTGSLAALNGIQIDFTEDQIIDYAKNFILNLNKLKSEGGDI